MDELLKMLLKLMESDVSAKEKEDTEQPSDKGEFKSLVTAEEVEHWENMNHEFKRYMDGVHIPKVLSLMNGSDLTAKQRVHYMIYLDFVTDLAKTLNCLATVNEQGVKAIEEVHNEKGVSYKNMEMHLFLNSVLGGARVRENSSISSKCCRSA